MQAAHTKPPQLVQKVSAFSSESGLRLSLDWSSRRPAHVGRGQCSQPFWLRHVYKLPNRRLWSEGRDRIPVVLHVRTDAAGVQRAEDYGPLEKELTAARQWRVLLALPFHVGPTARLNFTGYRLQPVAGWALLQADKAGNCWDWCFFFMNEFPWTVILFCYFWRFYNNGKSW